MHAETRILRETARLNKAPPPGISGGPRPDNYRYFDILLEGPSDSPYQGGLFKLELFLPEDYPLEPPKVRFLTRIYHPNIDRIGRICLSTLKLPRGADKSGDGAEGAWTPALNIETTLISIQSLLCEPNPEDPLDTGIADHWIHDRAGAEAKAREWTRLYAGG